MANTELMKDIDRRYRQASGLASRDHYSIFYGPLAKSRLLMLNANPGGSPDNYRIVDTLAGQHEYIEGRDSGPTTRNGARILEALAGGRHETIRSIQVLNRFFRRSPNRPSAALERQYMEEARPFLAELIRYIEPDAIIFGGDAGVRLLANSHEGQAVAGDTIMGPNGTHQATYLCEYELRLPYYRPVRAYGIYHPSKINAHFDAHVMPVLQKHITPLLR